MWKDQLRLLQWTSVWFPSVLETEMLLDGTLPVWTDFPDMPPAVPWPVQPVFCLGQKQAWPPREYICQVLIYSSILLEMKYPNNIGDVVGMDVPILPSSFFLIMHI